MPNGFESFMQGALALGDRWHQERQQNRLSQALSTYDTDPEGAAVAATKVDPVFGANLTNQVKANALARQNADHTRSHQALQDVISYLRPSAQAPDATPESIGRAYDSMAPIMSSALGMTPQEIAQWRQTITTNPGILDDIDEHSKNTIAAAPGTAVIDKTGGRARVLYRVPQADQILTVGAGDGHHDVVTVPHTYNGQPAPGAEPAPVAAGGSPGAPAPAGVPPPGSPERKALYDAIAMQETSNTPGKLGPQTKYGRAAGIMGTMPATAQEMALKLGMPWRPELLTGTDKQSEAYQRAVGQAYFDQGLDKTGNVRDALHYYYSGSENPKRWGPNTQKYPGQVASRMDPAMASQFGLTDGGSPSTDGAAPAAAGPHVVFSSAPKPASQTEKGWRPMTPDEITQRGLDPKVQWQVGVGGTHDGEIKIIGPANQMGGKNGAGGAADSGARYDAMISDMTRLRDLATTLKAHPGLDHAVGWMSYLPNIRGGHAADFDAQLRTFRSQIGFGVLQHLREMSKTGGAIGRVSNYEAQLLQDNLGSLDEGQSPESFRQNLDKVVNYANEAIGRFGQQKTSAAAPPRQQQPASGGSAPPQAGGAATIHPQAVQMLKQNPSALARKQFDSVFGAGASTRVLGGQ